MTTASSQPRFYVVAEKRLAGRLQKMHVRYASDTSIGGHIHFSIGPETAYIEKHAKTLMASAAKTLPEWGFRLERIG